VNKFQFSIGDAGGNQLENCPCVAGGFQFSIGDAAKRRSVPHLRIVEVPFQFSIGDAATDTEHTKRAGGRRSFNSLLEMHTPLSLTATTARIVSILYWRCPRLCTTGSSGTSCSGFNSLLEMPKKEALSRFRAPITPLFQFSIGDAAVDEFGQVVRIGESFNSLLEMQTQSFYRARG